MGAAQGRYGYGNIYVFASGNGGQLKDNCNFDGYANSIYTLTVGKNLPWVMSNFEVSPHRGGVVQVKPIYALKIIIKNSPPSCPKSFTEVVSPSSLGADKLAANELLKKPKKQQL